MTIRDGETIQVQGSGAKPYELKNVGGVFSCSCPAWRNQKTPIEKRTCKHLKKVLGDAHEAARTATASPFGIKSFEVRSEGDINADWKVTFDDGSVREWYSIDQGSPQSSDDDERLWDTDPKLAEFLMEAWFSMDVATDYDQPLIYHAVFDGTGKILRKWEERADV